MEGIDEYIVVLRVELFFSVDPKYTGKNDSPYTELLYQSINNICR